ncbi:unnamed protein product, partial [marine sediment metagenome]
RKYAEAVASFRKALAHETADPLAPQVLFNIAYCMERSGASPLEVEERYTEVRTRYPESEYARRADYRMARMALESRQYYKAVERYEFYLNSWPIQGEPSQNACRDLIISYLRTEDHVRAILLGEITCSTFGHVRQYWQALPALLDSYEEVGMREPALGVIERALAAAEQPARRWAVMLDKARFLVDLQDYEEADKVLTELEQLAEDKELLHSARLLKGRILMAQEEPAQGLELCRQVALESRSDQTRASALKLMGRYYEMTKRFDMAALAYAGRCP